MPSYTEAEKLVRLQQERRKKLLMVGFTKTYVMNRMIRLGNFLDMRQTQEVPIMVAPPTGGAWWAKGDNLPEGQRGQKAMGYWSNRYAAVATTWDEFEAWEEEGDPMKLWDLLDMKEMETAWALRRLIESGMWNGTGGKQPDGIVYAIEKRAPNAQTSVITGVDKSAKAWWRNQYVQMTANAGYVAPGSRLPAIILALSQLLDQTTIGTNTVSDLVTNRSVFSVIRRAFHEMSTDFHMMSKVEDANFGFEHFIFEGKMLAWDANCPSDSIYALPLTDSPQAWRTNNTNDKTFMDSDIDEVGVKKFLDLDTNVAILRHPNIRRRAIAPRNSPRSTIMAKWIMDSFNIGWKSMPRCGVVGSDNGSRLSTWR